MTPTFQDVMNIHTPIISFLVCTGLGTNFMFLMSLKADKPKLNNNDKIQVMKTGFVLMAITFYIPAEILAMQEGKNTNIACVAKGNYSIKLSTAPAPVCSLKRLYMYMHIIVCVHRQMFSVQ